MPELPEVYILQNKIKPLIINQTITSFTFDQGKFHKKPPANFDSFTNDLPLKVSNVYRKGKSLIIHFNKKNKNWFCCILFGLHGFLRYNDNKFVQNYYNNKKNIHGTLKFNDIDDILYVNTTGFGTSFSFFNNIDDYRKFLNTFAIDILDKNFTESYLIDKIENFKNKKKLICVALMSKSDICSGIGNYMKSEILYDSNISPYRSIDKLTKNDISKLHKSIIKITNIHIKNNGKSQDYFKVYNRKIDDKNNNIIYEKTPDKRYTYWVKELQN